MSFKKLFFVVLLAGILIAPVFVFASESPSLILFHGEECPHCQAERAFLENLKKEMPDLEIIEYEVWHNDENRKLFLETAEKLGIKRLGVPLTIIGEEFLIGFDKPENSGEKIREMLETEFPVGNSVSKNAEDLISHPIFGKIDIKNLSLSVLAVVLGTLDGFNPCSMWSLLVLLTLVIATGSRKKVWLVGGVFILTSAVSYFLFMSAWLNAFIFVGYFAAVQIIVGAAAIIAGAAALRSFYKSRPAACEVASPEKQRKIAERAKKILHSSTLPAMLLGVIGIAFSVNLIELLCSLGIPVVFTKTLAMHNLAAWKYYGYIGLYDFFYMLDDLAVLAVAGFSMRFLRLNGRYSRWSRFIAGILMLILGLIFLFKPELLMVG